MHHGELLRDISILVTAPCHVLDYPFRSRLLTPYDTLSYSLTNQHVHPGPSPSNGSVLAGPFASSLLSLRVTSTPTITVTRTYPCLSGFHSHDRSSKSRSVEASSTCRTSRDRQRDRPDFPRSHRFLGNIHAEFQNNIIDDLTHGVRFVRHSRFQQMCRRISIPNTSFSLTDLTTTTRI